MSVFKTRGVVLKTGKYSENEVYYKIFFESYGTLTVKKRKKAREKPLDIGYLVACEIITHSDRKVHTIGNIKILSFFNSEQKTYKLIENFMKILLRIYKEIPEGIPHKEIYDIISYLVEHEKTMGQDLLLLSHLKVISYLGNLPEEHTDQQVRKTLSFIHKYKHKDIIKLGEIPEELRRYLESIL